MIGPDDFIAALPAQVAPQLGDDVHLWRLPHARDMGRLPLLALLSAYLDADRDSFELRDDEHGKPRLFVRGEEHHGLEFNWSHSGALAVVALARGVATGVDIEQSREGVKTLEIAQRFFSPREARHLAAANDSVERDALFFRLWCAKEAVLKALGRGLSFGLERVAFDPTGDGWQPGHFDVEAGAAEKWRVQSFSPAAGCFGALAWRGETRAVRTWAPTGDRPN